MLVMLAADSDCLSNAAASVELGCVAPADWVIAAAAAILADSLLGSDGR